MSCWRLTHWGRVTHLCVGKLIIIGSDNGLSPDRRQAIIWTNSGLLSIGPLRTYFSENLIKIQQFSLKKMHVNMSSAKCLGFNVLSAIAPISQGHAMTWKHLSHCWPFVIGTGNRRTLLQRPAMRAFDIYFISSPNKPLNEQSCCRWFETPSLLRDITVMTRYKLTECLEHHQ